jgi:hypothetical protein
MWEVNFVEIDEKLKILKSLDTKDLIAKIHQYEYEFEKALAGQADFKSQNHQFLGSGDCQEIKRILAELAAHAPETNEAGKKMTLADKEVWLQKQRAENKELSEAIQKQRMVSFLVDDNQIRVEMAKTRLTSARSVLALKTAQIEFLAKG